MKLYPEYRKQITLIALVGLMVWSACGDDTFNKAIPNETSVSAKSKKEDVEIIDSLKNAFKDNSLNNSYQFTITPKGTDENATTYLIYTLETGSGVLKRDNRVLKDTVKVLIYGAPIALSFTPDITEGDVVLRFASYNQFGLESKSSTVVRLYIFKNLPPIAKFTVVTVDASKYLYNLDASESIDGDGMDKYGGTGKIKMYEYTISWNGKLMPLLRGYEKITPADISGQGKYIITLKVVDNEGMYSPPAIRIINVN